MSLLVSFVMCRQPRGRQTDKLESAGERAYLRLDLPQRMQLLINNPLFTSFIISDKFGNNCVILNI